MGINLGTASPNGGRSGGLVARQQQPIGSTQLMRQRSYLIMRAGRNSHPPASPAKSLRRSRTYASTGTGNEHHGYAGQTHDLIASNARMPLTKQLRPAATAHGTG